jgi:Bifunctional DNA primase/polymerase, N-terminal
MKDVIKKYKEHNLIVFSIQIDQKKHSSGIWKKVVSSPKDWQNSTLEKAKYNAKYNGVALLTGKVNNIIVIDVDNIEHWKQFLEENKQEEPDTVKTISGSGGYHYYFKYEGELENVTSKDHCFNKKYDIDIRNNGGCVIAPPTKYMNYNFEKEVEYTWEKNIFDYEVKTMPEWMKKLLLEVGEKKETTKKRKNK